MRRNIQIFLKRKLLEAKERKKKVGFCTPILKVKLAFTPLVFAIIDFTPAFELISKNYDKWGAMSSFVKRNHLA